MYRKRGFSPQKLSPLTQNRLDPHQFTSSTQDLPWVEIYVSNSKWFQRYKAYKIWIEEKKITLIKFLGPENTFLVHLPYLLNRLEFSAHILTQGRSWAELVPLRGLVDFGLGGSDFGAKTAFLVLLPYLLNDFDLSAHILT